MQIISGAYRGRKLNLPRGARPTQNRARIALFNMLDAGIISPGDTMNVWDAFAGSGAFGIECLSRYAGANVVFTDISADSLKTIRANLSALDIGSRAVVLNADAITAADKYAAVSDLIFIDPPYSESALGAALVRKIAGSVRAGTIVIWEQDGPSAVMPNADAWDILRDKKYGRARFFIMQRHDK